MMSISIITSLLLAQPGVMLVNTYVSGRMLLVLNYPIKQYWSSINPPSGQPTLTTLHNPVWVDQPGVVFCDSWNISAFPQIYNFHLYIDGITVAVSGWGIFPLYPRRVLSVIKLSCVVSNTLGESEFAESVELEFIAPPVIEPQTEIITEPIYRDPVSIIAKSEKVLSNGRNLIAKPKKRTIGITQVWDPSSAYKLVCVASGYQRKITWYKESRLVPHGVFIISTENVTGNFSYSQEEAIKSTLMWRPRQETCGELSLPSGTYDCVAHSQIGADPATDYQTFTVNLQYAPINRFQWHDEATIESDFSSNVTLHCDTCGNPPPSFQWSRNGKILSGETKNYLIINKYMDYNHESYACHVSNDIGTRIFEMKVVRTSLHVLLVVALGSTSMAVTVFGILTIIYLVKLKAPISDPLGSPSLVFSSNSI